MRNPARCLTWTWIVVLAFSTFGAAASKDARLADAAKAKNVDAARLLLKQGADVNGMRGDGSTALHWAAHWDDVGLATLLLRAGAKVDALDAYGVTPLSLACLNGSAAMLRVLVEAETNPNLALPSGETPLMTAARAGSAEAVEILVKKGATLDAREKTRGQNALMWAAAEGHTDVIHKLIELGADPKARSTAGYTPLLLVARTGRVDAVAALLEAGADVNAQAKDGTTALLIATVRSQTALGEYLLVHGADPNLGSGFQPLHWAAGDWQVGTHNVGEEHIRPKDTEWSLVQGLRGEVKTAYIRKLLDHGADVNLRAKGTPRYSGSGRGGNLSGGTPFLMAVMAGDVPVMRLLLEHGADPKITTEEGATALIAAAGRLGPTGDNFTSEADALAAVKLCVELGVDVNATTKSGDTALHGASWRGPVGAESIAKFLIERGANLNAKNNRGWTPLIISEGLYFNASNTQSLPLAEIYRKAGAEPSPPGIDRDGDALVEVENSVVLPELRNPQ